METQHLRPWGPLEWILTRLKVPSWGLLGCNSAEERCIATFRELRSTTSLACLVRIHDPEPADKAAFLTITDRHKGEMGAVPFTVQLPDAPLMADLDEINQHVETLRKGPDRTVILDISAMPKRWFFPIVKMLLDEPGFQTVLVTYASPTRYADVLAENPDPIRVLPGYNTADGREEHDSLFVGIGYEPLGLTPLFTEIKFRKLTLIFPFPPGPPGFRRNWMFVKSIEDVAKSRDEPLNCVQIHMHDCPQIFDALSSLTNNGTYTAALAPYGPKPLSLARIIRQAGEKMT